MALGVIIGLLIAIVILIVEVKLNVEHKSFMKPLLDKVTSRPQANVIDEPGIDIEEFLIK
jgi:hypothetical protein